MSDSDSDGSSVASIASENIDTASEYAIRKYHDNRREHGWRHGCPLYGMDHPHFGKVGVIVSAERSRVARLFSVEDWEYMGDGIADMTDLVHISLKNCGLTEDKIRALFLGDDGDDDRVWNFHLHSLSLSDNPFGRAGIEALQQFLKSMPAIHELWFDNVRLGDTGVRVLANFHLGLTLLSLQRCSIGDDGIKHLLSSAHSSMLEKLDISENNFGREGFDTISSFLAREGTALKTLFVTCNNGEHAKLIANALTSNRRSKLEFIELDSNRLDALQPAVQIELKQLFCDTTSFDSLINSNHLIWNNPGDVHGYHYTDDDTKTLIDLNKRREEYGTTPTQILRSKLRRYYFEEEWEPRDFDTQPFAKMDTNLMPRVLQLVTRIKENMEPTVGDYKSSRGSVQIPNTSFCPLALALAFGFK